MTEFARYTVSDKNGSYCYILLYELISQNIAQNYSDVKLQAIIQVNAGSISWTRGNATLHNEKFGLGATYYRGNNEVKTINIRLQHDNQGRCSTTIVGSISTSWLMNGSCQGTITLPNIPRQANIDSATDFNDEENPSMTFSNPGNFKVKCYLEKSGMTNIVRENITGTSCTFELTDEERTRLRTACKDSNSCTIRYVAQTIIGNDNYWSWTDRKMTIINANPTIYINSSDIKDTNPTTLALTQNNSIFIKGYSTLTVPIIEKATAKKGATIAKYKLINEDQNAEVNESNEDVSISLNNVMQKKNIISAYDSRNNVVNGIVMIQDFREYFTPKIIDLNIYRTDGGVSKNVMLEFNGTFWNDYFGNNSLSKNNLMIFYKYKSSNSTEWQLGTMINPNINENTFNASSLIKGDLGADGFDIDTSYDVQLIVQDKLGSTNMQTILASGSPAIDINKNNVSLGGPYNEEKGGRVQLRGMPIDDFFGTIYSKEEHVIGKWINGKPLYQKVIFSPILPNNGTLIQSAGLLYDDVNIVKLSGIAIRNDETFSYPLPDHGSGGNNWTRLVATSDSNQKKKEVLIEITTGLDRNDFHAYVFLEYTKKAD